MITFYLPINWARLLLRAVLHYSSHVAYGTDEENTYVSLANYITFKLKWSTNKGSEKDD